MTALLPQDYKSDRDNVVPDQNPALLKLSDAGMNAANKVTHAVAAEAQKLFCV